MAPEDLLTHGTKFGTLESVDPRTCWPDEARNLTPWIASSEGLALLGRALQMELACENCEVPVGPFSADILARDLSDNSLVVIENQLERTDHDHFGKSLTYAAILGAKTIVWVAKTFTDEHRKAVEWLNELTKGDLQFYGIELQVWRIGKSERAPRFEIVCGPNEVVQAATRAKDTVASPTEQLQLEFWTEVRKTLEASGQFKSLQAAKGRYWFNIAIGRAHVFISLIANSWDGFVGVRLYMNHRVADQVLRSLSPDRETIEQEMGERLEWNPFPEKMDKIIRLNRQGDISNREQWPELARWLTHEAIEFKRSFAPRILRMNLSASPDSGKPDSSEEV
jgi:hypothetical protein